MKKDSRKPLKKKREVKARKAQTPLQPPPTAYLNLLKRPFDTGVATKK